MPNFQIGTQLFLSIDGQPTTPQRFVEVLTRPNVDGVLLRAGGVMGEPFECESFVDVANETDARNLRDFYIAMKGNGPHSLIYNGVDYNSLSTKMKVHVLKVEVTEVQVVRCVVGGLVVAAGNSGVLVRARWVLQPINV